MARAHCVPQQQDADQGSSGEQCGPPPASTGGDQPRQAQRGGQAPRTQDGLARCLREREVDRDDRYAGALKLAELILRSTSIATSRGKVRSVAFVFDMNRVFEDFLSASLRMALEWYGGNVQMQYSRTYLDTERRLRLKPDITWWRGGACRAIIDAKYKALTNSSFPNADAYQMLAYCTAFGLDRGYLVYARDGKQELRDHTVHETGTRIRVRAIDVEQEPADVLREVDALAAAIAA